MKPYILMSTAEYKSTTARNDLQDDEQEDESEYYNIFL